MMAAVITFDKKKTLTPADDPVHHQPPGYRLTKSCYFPQTRRFGDWRKGKYIPPSDEGGHTAAAGLKPEKSALGQNRRHQFSEFRVGQGLP